MPKPKVYCTHPLFEEARKLLDANCDAEYWANADSLLFVQQLGLTAVPGSRG